ncbi:ATP-binding protein [Spirochaetia bacterium]|nr:ATP-binding protein [Spirochaetia bacterium]
MDNNTLDIRKQEELLSALRLAEKTVNKTYIENLNELEIIECPRELQDEKLHNIAQFFKIDRFVHEKKENNRDKLMSIYHAVASANGSIIVLLVSDGTKVSYYIGTKIINSIDSADILEKSIKGNFPGTIIKPVYEGEDINNLVSQVFEINDRKKSKQQKQVCTVTGIAGLRSKEESHEKQFVQGIEKLIDSMQGESYSILLIADPMSSSQINAIKHGYENLYSQLATFASTDLNFSENESASISNSISKGLSKSISKSVSDTISHTTGSSHAGSAGLGMGIGLPFGGPNAGVNFGYSYSTNKSDSTSKGVSVSKSESESKQKTIGDSLSQGTSRSMQIKFEDKTVRGLLEKIDLQLKRLNTSIDTGMWNCSVYCLADMATTAKMVASEYLSLLRGENSSVETAALTKWANDEKIIPYLKKMHHPVLKLDGNAITPSSYISGSELSIHAGFPGRSVGGLPVLETASFGREVITHSPGKNENEQIPLGKIFHMGNVEHTAVNLLKDSLTSHAFITGSTGSGKSNTVYNLLEEIRKSGSHFLVIESAKGEYKNIFGHNKDVSVFGTHPDTTLLLHLNPFSFPNGNENLQNNIHILEHLDRLIEIFNVCWPMYAAMPAVLKDALEASYESAGWDLKTSKNRYSSALYPSFADVVDNIQMVMDTSDYSDENKGNYKGALVTRLKSLSNGINGMIFSGNELSNEKLFDENVIVDLSRVGSTETKALIMGLLVLKLQEYRQTSGDMNSGLKHVTVLEEAHNLLKRTSTEQSNEGSNLLGKSVEMLGNAIAEMRTYGEGFIIADQSPGLLDMSVIRNTNTKIILRLPDESDRVLVGKSAGLNDDQIAELARLQCGVAAVYQNDWLQSVLCKVDNHEKLYGPYAPYMNEQSRLVNMETSGMDDELKLRITKYLLSNTVKEMKAPVNENIDSLRALILVSNIQASLKISLIDFIADNKVPVGIEPVYSLIAGLYLDSGRQVRKLIAGAEVTGDWAKSFRDEIIPSITGCEWELQKYILQCIAVRISDENKKLSDLPVKLREVI